MMTRLELDDLLDSLGIVPPGKSTNYDHDLAQTTGIIPEENDWDDETAREQGNLYND
jgi:hypothetical protein